MAMDVGLHTYTHKGKHRDTYRHTLSKPKEAIQRQAMTVDSEAVSSLLLEVYKQFKMCDMNGIYFGSISNESQK